MHYTATTWSRCHSDCTTHLWEGAQTPSWQRRPALSLQCNDFLLCPPPCCLCSLLDPPASHVNQMHVTGFTPSVSMVLESTSPLPPQCWVGMVLQPWRSSSPKHLHCCSRARDELQLLQHSNCPTQDVHQHGPAACQSCSRCLSLPVWMVAQVLQGMKKLLFLEGPAAVRAGFTRSKAEGKDPRQTQSPGWAVFVSLSNPDVQTAGDRLSKSRGWNNLGIFFLSP